MDYLERKPEGLIIERGNPFEDLDDYKFFERFRLTKETVSNLEFVFTMLKVMVVERTKLTSQKKVLYLTNLINNKKT